MLTRNDNHGVKVIVSAGRKKHEKETAECRTLITIYRTGSVAGDTGPTVCVMKGKGKRNWYTDARLGIKSPRQVNSQMHKKVQILGSH
jgi:hypothetical protein